MDRRRESRAGSKRWPTTFGTSCLSTFQAETSSSSLHWVKVWTKLCSFMIEVELILTWLKIMLNKFKKKFYSTYYGSIFLTIRECTKTVQKNAQKWPHLGGRNFHCVDEAAYWRTVHRRKHEKAANEKCPDRVLRQERRQKATRRRQNAAEQHCFSPTPSKIDMFERESVHLLTLQIGQTAKCKRAGQKSSQSDRVDVVDQRRRITNQVKLEPGIGKATR